jgi:serine/threonine protein kinase
MLAPTLSNTELLQRALSHVQAPGESHRETLARVAPQLAAVTKEQLLLAGFPPTVVATMLAKAAGGGGDRIDLSQFGRPPSPAVTPPAGASRRQSTELVMQLDSVATGDLYSDDEWDAAMSPSPAVRSEPRAAAPAPDNVTVAAATSDEFRFVTAAACRRPVPGREEGNLLGDGTGCDGVFRLTSPITGTSYAVKKIRRPRPGTGAATNLNRELQILHGLRHPGVCRLHAHVQDPSYHLLVLTLCEEGDLFELVANRSIADEATAREYFVRILDALGYLHSINIFHRDLKLENILVRSSVTREIEINDFGHSRLCSSLSAGVHSRGYGTVAYMAPEMFQDADNSDYDPAAVDVWSLGVMLYVMLAVGYPFGFDSGPRCQTTREVRRRICNAAPKPNSDFQFAPAPSFASEDLRALLCGMLTVDAARRATIAQIRDHPWVTAAAPLPPVEHHPERPPLDLDSEPLGWLPSMEAMSPGGGGRDRQTEDDDTAADDFFDEDGLDFS